MASLASRTNINLVRARHHKLKQQKILFAKIQTVALVVLVVYGIFLASVVSFRALEKNQLKKVETKIKSERQLLEELRPVQIKQEVVKHKLKLIGAYFDNIRNTRKMFLKMYAAIPEGVSLTETTWGENESSITLKGDANDVYAMNAYLDVVEDLLADEGFSDVGFESINRSEDALYHFETSFALESADKKKS
jgi:Tfp pilus assembly protein PilN